MEPKLDLRNDRGAATRQLVIGRARRLFADIGYDEMSIELVLKASGISKGALYHHFRGKEALFSAVLEEVEVEIVKSVAEAAKGARNPLDALRAGCGGWLDLVDSDPEVRRIAVIDAPSVLGWRAWRELEGRYALGMLEGAFHAAAEAGCFPFHNAMAYASMLLASLNEMAMLIARAEDRSSAIPIARGAIELLISSLVGVTANGSWESRVRHPKSQAVPASKGCKD